MYLIYETPIYWRIDGYDRIRQYGSIWCFGEKKIRKLHRVPCLFSRTLLWPCTSQQFASTNADTIQIQQDNLSPLQLTKHADIIRICIFVCYLCTYREVLLTYKKLDRNVTLYTRCACMHTRGICRHIKKRQCSLCFFWDVSEDLVVCILAIDCL